jgi:mRNA-degrading endonuclease RelE of RelBE toxin-antitoxin system
MSGEGGRPGRSGAGSARGRDDAASDQDGQTRAAYFSEEWDDSAITSLDDLESALAYYTHNTYSRSMRLARVIATATYEKRVVKWLTSEDRMEMEAYIVSDPEAHPIIPGTKGVRKARWSRPGMGKRGGLRLIYYFWVEPNAVLLLTVYAKNEKENLSDADKKEIRKIVESLKRTE